MIFDRSHRLSLKSCPCGQTKKRVFECIDPIVGAVLVQAIALSFNQDRRVFNRVGGHAIDVYQSAVSYDYLIAAAQIRLLVIADELSVPGAAREKKRSSDNTC